MPNKVHISKRSNPEIYSLKHKDLDVALVYVNSMTGTIEHILDVYLPEELPVGCMPNGQFLCDWWRERAIPESRSGILMGKTRIPYRKEIRFSPDLLRGERKNVMRTALEFYYGQASDIAEGYELAAAYRKKANLQIRELPGKKGANL